MPNSSRCWIPEPRLFRRKLLAWYDANRRALPWRQAHDFYTVWLSEIMLQQTRVEAVIPYYLRFLERFPTLAALAEAPEPAVLAAWSGLGYYSRARNLHRAARAAAGQPPTTYDEVRALPGIGPYTAAAIASIAFGERYAAVDGNVIRVISRLKNDAGEVAAGTVRRRLGGEAERLLDRTRPGDFNQAMMELGATICVPRVPRCGECPVLPHCEGKAAGRERELPVKARKAEARELALDLLILRRGAETFLVQRGSEENRLAGFWELPEKVMFAGLSAEAAGQFTHRIVNDRFRVSVWRGTDCEFGAETVESGQWFREEALREIPLTTIARKALQLLHNYPAATI